MRNTNNIRKIDANTPNLEVIFEAVRILKSGGIVSFPTRCLYGLGADALNHKVVDRVFRIKQRALDKPLLILVPDRHAVAGLVNEIPPDAVKIMDKYWPGQITIVLAASSSLPSNLLAGTDKIGIRLPGHPLARALVEAFGGPITGTSANISGQPGSSRVDDIDPLMIRQLDLVLDAGPLQGGTGSTIVDVTEKTPVVLREGAVSRAEIIKIL